MFCVAVTVGAVVALWPGCVRRREPGGARERGARLPRPRVGGGNSVLPDQAVAIEAEGRIPADETFAVAVGDPQEGWSELSTPDAIAHVHAFLPPPASRER